jgi:hypothetical protein
MSQAGFEPTIPASERPQTHALDRAATQIGPLNTSLGAPYYNLDLRYIYVDEQFVF